MKQQYPTDKLELLVMKKDDEILVLNKIINNKNTLLEQYKERDKKSLESLKKRPLQLVNPIPDGEGELVAHWTGEGWALGREHLGEFHQFEDYDPFGGEEYYVFDIENAGFSVV